MFSSFIQKIKSIHFWFALSFYLLITFTVTYGIFTLLLFLENKLSWPPGFLMYAAAAGIAFGTIFVFLFSNIKQRLFSSHLGAFDLHPINTWFIAIVFLIAIGLLLIAHQYSSSHVEIRAAIDNLSEGLLLFGSFVSICGLFYMGYSIKEYRRQITSFPLFAKRLKRMILETSGDTDRDYVRIMAYTPIPGSLALKEKDYKELNDKMMQPDARLEIVCLNQEALASWFDKFKDKHDRNKKVTQDKINQAKCDIERLLQRVDDPDTNDKRNFAEKHKSKRLRADQLPDYYFFFNDTRAIVTTPFFFPEMPDNIVTDNNTFIAFENEPVEMIGFETTDMKIIENVKKYYTRLRT